MRLKFKIKTITFTILTTFIFGLFFIWQNNDVVITDYEYKSSNIPKGFEDFKIVQISDLHNKEFHGRISNQIERLNPDIILITGDLIDRRNTKIDIALKFVEEITPIAPIYFVSGNHEQLSDKYDILKSGLERLNVNILDNGVLYLAEENNKIGILGLADPAIQQNENTYLWENSRSYLEKNLKEMYKNIDTNFNILLSHRPEQFSLYSEMNIDLVFSGHAHGGQIRIPFIGGLVAPNQGFFPKYTEGIYKENTTSMVVSRGLGNSIFPLRVLNRPELVVVSLKRVVVNSPLSKH